MSKLTRVMTGIGILAAFVVLGIAAFAPQEEHLSGDNSGGSFEVPKSPLKGRSEVVTSVPADRPLPVETKRPKPGPKPGSMAADKHLDNSMRRLVAKAARLFASHPSRRGKQYLLVRLKPLLTAKGIRRLRRAWHGPDIGVGGNFSARAKAQSAIVPSELERIGPNRLIATAFVQQKMAFPRTPSTTTLRQISVTLVRKQRAWIIDKIAFASESTSVVGT